MQNVAEQWKAEVWNYRLRFVSVLLAAVLIVALLSAAAQTGGTRFGTQSSGISGSPGSIRPGHMLVRFRTIPSQDLLSQLNATFGARVAGTIAGIGVTHLQVPPERQFALLENLCQRSDVQFAEFDSYVQEGTAPLTFVPTEIAVPPPISPDNDANVAKLLAGASLPFVMPLTNVTISALRVVNAWSLWLIHSG
jgi:hypothetical protein